MVADCLRDLRSGWSDLADYRVAAMVGCATKKKGQRAERRWVMHIRIEFKLQDLWLGVFWKITRSRGELPDCWLYEDRRIDVWVCIVPTLPIHMTFWLPDRKYRNEDEQKGGG